MRKLKIAICVLAALAIFFMGVSATLLVVITNRPESVPMATPTPVITMQPEKLPFATLVPTAIPVVTATTIPTQVPTEVPTATPVPTSTPTAVPTATPVPTSTPTAVPTATPVPTATFVPTATPVPTKVATPTPTFVPDVTPTAIPTSTPTIVPTVVPTTVPTSVPTQVPIVTAVPTQVPVVTVAPTKVPGNASLDPLKRELKKTNVGNEIYFSYNLGKARDFYNSIDITGVNHDELYAILEPVFVNVIAHSVNFSFSTGGTAEDNFANTLSSGECYNCGRLILTYNNENTGNMANLMMRISNKKYANEIMLDFLNEFTAIDPENPNTRLFLVCPGH